MKKRVLIFAVLLCTVISLCACSGKQNRNTENSGSTSGSAAETDSRASSEKPDIPDSSPGQSSSSDISDAQKSRTPESSVSESGTSESDASGGKESSAGGTSLPETGRDTDPDDPYSSEAEQSAPSGLPDGLKRASDTKLTFTSSVLSLSATFSDEFCVLNRDYTPKYGIYLQNKQGTATLLAESVEDTTDRKSVV